MDNSFDGRRVLVTGGTGALGEAVVKTLLDGGARCEVTWLVESELRHFTLRDRVNLHQVDVASEPAVEKLYGEMDDLWASLHIVGGFAMSPIEKTSIQEFRRLFEMNALTCFLCCREAVKAIRGSGKGGRIVNVSARSAIVPTGGMIPYSTSKAAVASITQCVAEEVKADGILVNAVLPSIMDTPANRRSMPAANFQDWPKVEQVAQAMYFLASPANALTSGALVPVYGKS